MSSHARSTRCGHLLAMLCCALAAGCAASPDTRAGNKDEPAGATCPSQDFTTFLQHYADSTNHEMRGRFTAEPLEHEVPTHRVEDETASSPPTRVSRQSGPGRLELFPYRYFKQADIFDRVDSGESSESEVARRPYPLAIAVLADNGRDVAFGAESEVDTYRFERKHDCWYLTRVIDLRD